MSDEDYYLRRVLDGALDAIVEIDADGIVLGWNAEAERLLGFGEGEALGERLDTLVLPPGQWPAFREAAGLRTELTLRHRDGSEIPVEASVTGAHLGGMLVLVAFLRDLRAPLRAERLRTAEHDVVRILANARTGDRPAEAVLEVIGGALDWQLCEWWERRGDVMVCGAQWGDGAPEFLEAARRLSSASGEGLQGLAWERRELVTLDDLEGDALRRSEAVADGVRGGVALPVVVGDEVAGVLTMWSTEHGEPPAPDAEDVLRSVAAALGQFERRRRAEEASADETLTLAAVTRAVRRLSSSNDPAAARDAICEAALEACDASIAYLAEPDDERGGLVVTAVAGAHLRDGPAAILPYDEPSAAIDAHRSGSAVFVPDVGANGSVVVRETVRALGTVSGLVQPVSRAGASLGVLGVAWSRNVGELPERTASVMRLLADEAAIALGRAALVSDLEEAARTDPLTGLPNLRAWDEALSRELASSMRDGRSVCVAIADVDGFKSYNDAHGHLAGDRLLRSAAAAWQESLRAGDVLARCGGDEFAALLPNCRLDGGAILAERLRQATPNGRTCSVGVAQFDGTEEPHELVARADAALYEAKAAGRDRVVAR